MTRIDKICVLGGSSINTPELFDALRVEQLEVGEVALVGRSADKLETVRQFCERYARDLGQDATRVSATTDVDAGMSGARFVINMIRVRGDEVWGRCKDIMSAYGLDGQALFYPGAVSNLAIVLDYAERMRRACPDAWLIEFTNPCGLHADEIRRRFPAVKVISGCNAPRGAREQVATLLGRDGGDDANAVPAGTLVGGVEVTWFGLNHCAWITEVTVDGESVMQEVIRRHAALAQPHWDVEEIERQGIIPIAAAARLAAAARRPADAAPPTPPADAGARAHRKVVRNASRWCSPPTPTTACRPRPHWHRKGALAPTTPPSCRWWPAWPATYRVATCRRGRPRRHYPVSRRPPSSVP